MLDKLNKLRKEIERLDQELIAAWESRMLLAREISCCKQALELPVTDDARECELWNLWQELLGHDEFTDELKRLFRCVLVSSKRLQA